MKDLIPADYSRCNNFECSKRFQCKRALQMDIDTTNTNPHPRGYSVTRFQDEDCQNILL